MQYALLCVRVGGGVDFEGTSIYCILGFRVKIFPSHTSKSKPIFVSKSDFHLGVTECDVHETRILPMFIFILYQISKPLILFMKYGWI
jgi:hypothetical protein